MAVSGSRKVDRVRDRRIERIVALTTPARLLDELPLSSGQAEVVVRGRTDVAEILQGTDDRLLVGGHSPPPPYAGAWRTVRTF